MTKEKNNKKKRYGKYKKKRNKIVRKLKRKGEVKGRGRGK